MALLERLPGPWRKETVKTPTQILEEELERVIPRLKLNQEIPIVGADENDGVMKILSGRRRVGILEREAYDVLNARFGRDENKYSWDPEEDGEITTDNGEVLSVGMAVHDCTNPAIVFVNRYSFTPYEKKLVAVTNAVRLRTGHEEGLLADPIKSPLDENFSHPFTPL